MSPSRWKDVGGKMNISPTRLRGLIVSIWLCNFATALDSGLSASAHTAIANTFRQARLATWPANIFLICSLITQPLYVRISDDIGRKRPYQTAIVLFTFSLALSAVSRTYAWLMLSRAVAGFGVGGMIGLASITLTEAVGLERRAYFQSANYLIYGAGSAIGSGIGGSIVENYGWIWVYILQIPAVCIALCLLSLSAPMHPNNDAESVERPGIASQALDILNHFDWQGSICLSMALIVTFIFLTTGGNVYDWTHPIVITTGISCLISIAALYFVEVRAKKPILHLRLLASFPIPNLVISGFMLNMINYTTMYHIPTFFQTVLADTAQHASARLVIPSMSYTLVSALTAFLIARQKTPYPTLYCGQVILLLGTGGLVLMAAMPPSRTPDWVYDCALIFPVAGASMLAPSALLALLNFTDDTNHAAATSSFIMARSLGVLAATAVGSSILQNCFSITIGSLDLTYKISKKIEEARQDIRLIGVLPSEIQHQGKSQRQRVIPEHWGRVADTNLVRKAFDVSFIYLFGFATGAALIVILSLRNVR